MSPEHITQPSRRATLLVGILVSFVVVAYYLPQAMRGISLAEGEGVSFYLPMRHAVAEAWSEGRLPVWNPYVYGGMPLLADCQAAAFYPLNLVYLWLDGVVAINVVAMLTNLIALWGMLLLLRAHRVSAWSSAVGTLVFVLGGFMVAHMGHVTIVNAACWMPWICLATKRWCESLHRRWLVMGILFWSLQFLAGHPQIVVYTAVLVFMQLIALRVNGVRLGWRAVSGLGLTAVIAMLICAVQILPTHELSSQTGRNLHASKELFSRYRLVTHQVPVLWVPYLFGTQAETPLHWPFWGDWNFVEQAGYAGLLPWMLLPAAAFLAGGRARMGRSWVVIALLHVVLAMNVDTPLGDYLFRVPLYNSFESAGRHLAGMILSLALCAGIGLDALAECTRRRARQWSRRGAVLVFGLVLMIVFGATWGYEYAVVHLHYGMEKISNRPSGSTRPLAQAAWVFGVPLFMAGLSAWALFRYATHRNVLARLIVFVVLFIDLGSAAYLGAWRHRYPNTHRVEPPKPRLVDLLAPEDESSPPPRYVLFGEWGQVQSINAQYNMVHKFESLNGYGPFQLRRYQQMVGGMHHGGFVDDDTMLCPSVALDLWSCRYVMIRQDEVSSLPDCFDDEAQYQLVANVDDVRIYENANVLPRAWFVDEAVKLEDDDAVLNAIVSGELPSGDSYDARRSAVVSSGQETLPTPVQEADATRATRAPSVTWRSYSPGRLVLATETAEAATLVLSNPYLKGWRATVDGQAVTISRVNYLLQGLSIPEGKHEVVLTYRPRSIEYGLWLSGAGLAGLLVVMFWPVSSRRADSDPEREPASKCECVPVM